MSMVTIPLTPVDSVQIMILIDNVLPVLIHPDFGRRRRIAIPGTEPAEFPATSRSALEGQGFEIVVPTAL